MTLKQASDAISNEYDRYHRETPLVEQARTTAAIEKEIEEIVASGLPASMIDAPLKIPLPKLLAVAIRIGMRLQRKLLKPSRRPKYTADHDSIPDKNCPFYGRHLTTVFNSPPPFRLIDQGGNQCAVITGSFSPCVLERDGAEVDWHRCAIARHLVMPTPHADRRPRS